MEAVVFCWERFFDTCVRMRSALATSRPTLDEGFTRVDRVELIAPFGVRVTAWLTAEPRY
jgi:hypothetical protein